MARAIQHVQCAVRACQALDDRSRKFNRHELVISAVDIEQRQSAEAAALGDRHVAAASASSVGRFQAPWYTSGSAA
jgi:hypothetical protein